jgi:hypothetical protein
VGEPFRLPPMQLALSAVSQLGLRGLSVRMVLSALPTSLNAGTLLSVDEDLSSECLWLVCVTSQ